MNRNTFGLKKTANLYANIFGLTIKGDYEYEYLDWYLQICKRIQIFVTH